MEQSQKPKWEKQIEKILQEQFQGDDLADRLKKAYELGELARGIKAPTGDIGELVAVILKLASEELYPLAATYTGFMLGVAYERLQNADRA